MEVTYEFTFAGMMVMTMTAIDYDDVEEGNNAKLTYSIEKNVIDENTGTPIFEIEETTGVIKTAVCCLDREKTPDYSIQVVAMDGGGLKGTGTASIKVHVNACRKIHWNYEHFVVGCVVVRATDYLTNN